MTRFHQEIRQWQLDVETMVSNMASKEERRTKQWPENRWKEIEGLTDGLIDDEMAQPEQNI